MSLFSACLFAEVCRVGRKGFGTAAAIALIEYCLSNDIEPYWDANNKPSAIMAENLGYSNPESYYVYKWVEKSVEDS